MVGFPNQTVLITGAGGGIGRALVARFSALGATIIAADRSPEALEGVPAAAQAICDLADSKATRAALLEACALAGPPDIVISNAGGTRAESFDHLDEAAFEAELALNLTGAYRVIDTVLAGMRARGSGAIVAIASVNALAHFGNPAYSAAKAGLIAYIRALAVELGRDGIRANAVLPGSVMTPAWDHRFARDPGLKDKVLRHYPLGRLVTPENVAEAVAFLASPLAAGITGVALPVDSGLTAGNLRFVRDIIGGEDPGGGEGGA